MEGDQYDYKRNASTVTNANLQSSDPKSGALSIRPPSSLWLVYSKYSFIFMNSNYYFIFIHVVQKSVNQTKTI